MNDVEKVKKYEEFLHLLQMHAAVTLNSAAVKTLIDNACNWSYSHRIGNGEYTDEEQQLIVNKAFDKLTEI